MSRLVEPAPWSAIKETIPDPVWLWDKWLPRGMATLLVAEPGCGKSSLALDLCKRILSSGFWPDSTDTAPGGPVVYIEAEGSPTILKGRIQSFNVPEENLYSFRYTEYETPGLGGTALITLNDPTHWATVVKTICELRPSFVVLDSLAGTHTLDENTAATKTIIMNLNQLAAATDCAVLVIHHLRKKRETDGDEITLDRVRGSNAISYMVRCAWAMQRVAGVRRLYQIKNSQLSEDEWPVLAFELRESGLEYCAAPLTASEEKSQSALGAAKDFLCRVLEDGPLPRSEILELAREDGHSQATLYRAKSSLHIHGYDTGDDYTWSLPEKKT